MSRLLAGLIALSFGIAAGASVRSDPTTTPAVGKASAPETGWFRSTTSHFVVSGDATAADVGRMAERLESISDPIRHALPRTYDQALLPVFVIAFGADRSFAPYHPPGIGVGGFAIHDPFMPCIVLRADGSDESFRTTVHEYVHVLFDRPWMPLWLTEGVADYYSTTNVGRGRRRVYFGDRIPALLAQAQRWWVPLARVVARSRESRITNDNEGLSFYAESWLLVHYLTRAAPDKGAQLSRFVDLLASGVADDTAFEQAIGSPAQVEIDLRRYLQNGILSGDERAVPAAGGDATPRPHAMTKADVDASIGRLLFHLRRYDDALLRLRAALEASPSSPEADVTLAMLHRRLGHRADALASLLRAGAADPGNVLVAYQKGLAALDGAPGSTGMTFEDADRALSRAMDGPRDWPADVLATRGTLAGRLGRLAEAERLLRHALRLDPRVPGMRVELANVCLRVGKFQEARSILTGILATPDASEAAAAQCRAWLDAAEARAAIRSELAAIAGLRDAGPDEAIGKTGTFPSSLRLRAPGATEQRQLGLLDAVDCPGARFIARVSTVSGPASFVTASLPKVHLSSARDDVSGALACGPRPRREAVYVTWKGDHELVAIEFLPLDLQPVR